jgi:hypothetical protein
LSERERTASVAIVATPDANLTIVWQLSREYGFDTHDGVHVYGFLM